MEWRSKSSVLLLAVTLLELLALVTSAQCPCTNSESCLYQKGEHGSHREVIVFNKATTDLSEWRWNSFTTLIAPKDFNITNQDQASTMCTTHENGRKFGITVDMDLSGNLNSTSAEADKWVALAAKRQSEWHADLVNIDLISYFLSDHSSTKEDHIELVKILKSLKDVLKNQTINIAQTSCMIPWKPPCAEKSDTCDFSWISMDVCDYFIISADSFQDSNDDMCRASATIPFAKLFYGISEYQSHSVPMNRVILGVPWHGYDFLCSDLTNDICATEKKTVENSTLMKCHFNKERVSLGDIVDLHSDEYKHKRKRSEIYNAPFLNYKENGTQHQVWFEDHFSLTTKYGLVTELGLKGIAVLYGDDLASVTVPYPGINKKAMWSWLAHEVLLETSQKPEKDDLHTADTVAGVAVGCLLLGVVLGVVFTCLALRNRVKKPKPAFHRDGGGMDEFMDDPDL